MTSDPLQGGRLAPGLLHFHKESVLPELLRRWRPVVVEIGVEQGFHTRELYRACIRRFGRLIAIDPHPAARIKRQLQRLPLVELIETTSLEALCQLVRRGVIIHVAIVDGDHNYYTVSHELRLVGSLLAPDGAVIVHDVGWPYGRRDMYYDPSLIPVSERQPHAKRGIARGRRELLDAGGFNAGVDNALYEGGPRNGVLTAVEDFVAHEAGHWSLDLCEEQFGLAVLRRKGNDPAQQEDASDGLTT